MWNVQNDLAIAFIPAQTQPIAFILIYYSFPAQSFRVDIYENDIIFSLLLSYSLCMRASIASKKVRSKIFNIVHMSGDRIRFEPLTKCMLCLFISTWAFAFFFRYVT